ncbi:MAG: TPM domain-containing protein [Thermosynechococcaceae cyanobacterium]
MKLLFVSRFFTFCLSLILALGVWVVAPLPAYAFNNPELLPDAPTAVIDLAKSLTNAQRDNLADSLDAFESDTGWKLRVLTQYDQTPGTAVKEFWGLDDKSVVLVEDTRGGNILNFNIGDEVYQLLPRTFWIELQTRFGNQYFVQENGEDQAIIQSLDAVQLCLNKGGCNVVPGLPQEQWVLTLVVSILGGVICGFAAHPRKEGQVFAWQWVLIFSPLWGILFFSFGIGPVVTRTSEWLPLARNIAGFLGGAIAAYLIQPPSPSSSGSEA